MATRNQGLHREVHRPKVKERFHVGMAAPNKKSTSAAADSGDDKPKPKPTPRPKPKGKPSAPAVGDSFFLEESDDEGLAASVKMSITKSKKISFNEDIGEIILNEAAYSIRDVWKSVIKKLRPDITRDMRRGREPL